MQKIDEEISVKKRIEIEKLNSELKEKMIYVKKDKVEEMKIEESIVVMNEGRIEKIG